MQVPFYHVYLSEELARRCRGNARYSLRAFARAIDLDPGTLSRVLSKKRPISLKHAQRVIARLPLSQEESTHFLESVTLEQFEVSVGSLGNRENAVSPTEVENERFRVIGDWYHLAILELTFVPGFRSDSRWIAKELGISCAEVSLAVDRLLRLGLLERNERGLRKTQRALTTKDKTRTSPYLKRHQKQMLESAIASLENDPIEERCLAGMTMAIDPTKLPIARRMLQDSMRAIGKLLESGTPRRVYQLECALFPLQRNGGDA